MDAAVGHAGVARVSIRSAAFARSLKPPLTIHLRYCLTMIRELSAHDGSKSRRQRLSDFADRFTDLGLVEAATAAQIR